MTLQPQSNKWEVKEGRSKSFMGAIGSVGHACRTCMVYQVGPDKLDMFKLGS